MSDLSSQLSAFKNKIRAGPAYTAPRRPINAPTPQARPPETPAAPKRPPETLNEHIKRQKLALQSMPGSHLSTQMHLAVEHIKQNDAPLSVPELAKFLTFDVRKTLLPLLKEVDRIRYDAKNDSLEYMSLHNIRSAEDLLNFLRSQPTFKGVSVKELKDGWTGCLEALSELEQENKILILRTKKENAPRLVWANLGGQLNLIDDEFRTMWSQVKVPPPEDLYQALVDQGLKPTGADPNLVKKRPKKEEKKQKKARRGKITNTHMKGILKDYSQLV